MVALGERRVPSCFALASLLASATSLTLPSFWTDEGASAEVARRSVADVLRSGSHIDGVHTFYYVLLHYWVMVFGSGEFSMRLPSAVCGAGTVYLIVRIAQLLDFTPRGVCMAGALALVLPGITWPNLEARDFALATFLVCLSVRGLVGMMHGEGRRASVLVLLGGLVAPLAEVYTVGIGLLELVVLWFSCPRLRVKGLRVVAPGVLVGCAFAVSVSQQAGQLTASEDAGQRFFALLRGIYFLGARNGANHLPVAFELTIAAAVLAWGLIVWQALTARSGVFYGLLTWAFAAPVAVFLVAVVRPAMFNEHYFSFGAPGLILLLAKGLEQLEPPTRGWAVTGVLVALLLPMQLTQRAQDAKAGDDYRALVASMPLHAPEAVWFDVPSGRSVASAYPLAFRGVRDVRLAESGAEGGNLWGRDRSIGASRQTLQAMAPRHLLVVYGRSGLSKSSGASAARSLGCRLDGGVARGRYSFAYYVCG